MKRPDGRAERARERLAGGIDRTKALVERYRALLVRLHQPLVDRAVQRARTSAPHPRLRSVDGPSR
jgi:hypothetical protein